MKLTINEIAEIARVAKSTVSKALNGQKGVSQEKRREILELAERLEYEPSASAQALASNRTGSIGLLIPHEAAWALSGSYWAAIITSIAQVANRNGYSLLILTPENEADLSAPVEAVIRRRNVDGLIIGAEQLDASVTARLLGEGIPFMFIGSNTQLEHYSVDVDNAGGSERLVTRFTEKGFRKIACLAGPAHFLYNQERILGYRRALEKAGITWSAVSHTVYTGAETKSAIFAFLAAYPDMDALFLTAGGDLLLDCIDVLKASGRNLKTFGFGAFDDYRFFDYVDLPVCSIRQPLREIGSTAAEMLFSFMSGKIPDPMHRILDVELILR